MAITPFEVIQCYRFLYQSKTHMRLSIDSYCTLSKLWQRQIIWQIFASFRRALNHYNVFADSWGYISLAECVCVSSTIYVIGPKSNRIRRNNANYTAITQTTRPLSRSRLFKVTDFGTTNREPICNYLLVSINSNLRLILHRFQVMAD